MPTDLETLEKRMEQYIRSQMPNIIRDTVQKMLDDQTKEITGTILNVLSTRIK
jgi:hypothetical protein